MFEAYSVAIRLRLIDSVSAGLIGMATQFSAFNRHVGASQARVAELEAQLKRIKTMTMVGGGALTVGLGGLYLFKAPLEEAKAWQQEIAKFSTLGFGDRVNKDSQKFALGMQNYGTSARENLALLGDAMAVFKDLGHAELAAPILAKMKFGNEAIFGASTGAANERQFMDMLKVVELRRGLSSPAEFSTQADFVQKAISGSRGRVGASQWLALLKTGGVGVSQLSNESFYLGLEPLLQEFGGSRLGTSLQSVYSNLVQGRGTVTAQQELYRLGLLDPSKVQFNSLGMLKKALPGAFRGSSIFETEGPMALIEKVLLPAFAKKGITTEPQILDEIGRIFSNRTASSLISRAYQQRHSIEMQAAANRNAMGIDASVAAGKNTPEGKMLELHSKWKDTLRELGNAVLPIAIKGVEMLTSVVKAFNSFATDFPTTTKVIVIATAALLALTALGGAVLIFSAGISALGLAFSVAGGVGIGGLITSLASGIGALGAAVVPLLANLATAGIVGYGVGKGINWLGPDHDLGGWIGGKFYEATHPYDGRDAGSGTSHGRVNRGGAAVPRGGGSGQTIHTMVLLDGRKVADAVGYYLGNDSGKPQTGPNFFDGRGGLLPAGAVGFK